MRAIVLQSNRMWYVISSTHTDSHRQPYGYINTQTQSTTCSIPFLLDFQIQYDIICIYNFCMLHMQRKKIYTNQRLSLSAYAALHMETTTTMNNGKRLSTSNLHLPSEARLPTLKFSPRQHKSTVIIHTSRRNMSFPKWRRRLQMSLNKSIVCLRWIWSQGTAAMSRNEKLIRKNGERW